MKSLVQSFCYLLARAMAFVSGLVVVLFFVNRLFKTDFGLWTGPAGSRGFTYAPESAQDLLLWLFMLGGTGIVAYLIEKALGNGAWFKAHPGKAPFLIIGIIAVLGLGSWGIINYGNSMAAENKDGKLLNAIADKAAPEIILQMIKETEQPGPTMSYAAFETAVIHDNLAVIPVLVQNGYDINAQTRELYKNSGSGVTVLMRASEAYSFNAVKTLLENGAKTDLKDSQKKTALHYAVNSFTEDKVENFLLLLKAKADPNVGNYNDETALHLLLKNKYLTKEQFEMVKLLVINGANLDLKDDNGNTPRKYVSATEYQYTPGQPEYYKELNELFKK